MSRLLAYSLTCTMMPQMWSGGVIKSTIHRVIYSAPDGVTPRYSIPFFLCVHGS
jgi:isopenicillin N synthase-like dioxygenase